MCGRGEEPESRIRCSFAGRDAKLLEQVHRGVALDHGEGRVGQVLQAVAEEVAALLAAEEREPPIADLPEPDELPLALLGACDRVDEGVGLVEDGVERARPGLHLERVAKPRLLERRAHHLGRRSLHDAGFLEVVGRQQLRDDADAPRLLRRSRGRERIV